MDTAKPEIASHVSQLLADVPKERGQLLPALWRVFEAYWRIGPEMIQAVSDTMNIPYADVYGVASFYALFDNPEGQRPIYVCTDVMCALKGSEALLEAGQEVAQGESVVVKEAPCLGHCDGAPAVFDSQRTLRHATRETLMSAMRGDLNV